MSKGVKSLAFGGFIGERKRQCQGDCQVLIRSVEWTVGVLSAVWNTDPGTGGLGQRGGGVDVEFADPVGCSYGESSGQLDVGGPRGGPD